MDKITPFLVLSTSLFFIGFCIIITKKNLILMLMGVELMLNAVNINFVIFSRYDSVPERGQIFTLFIMLIAAAEVAIGLAIILKIKEFYKGIDPEKLNILKN